MNVQPLELKCTSPAYDGSEAEQAKEINNHHHQPASKRCTSPAWECWGLATIPEEPEDSDGMPFGALKV